MAERTESQENYIEVIHILSKKKPVVRSVDIANELGFKKPSVSIAMKSLKEQELITITEEGYIYLTPAGLKIAKAVYERHQVLTDILIKLGVPADIAEDDACRIEHVISEKTFKAIKAHCKKNNK
ncbi:MAG: metal-dependent transcriptional regulator [Lachnospiraceae bacterium]|nr:metal-dependent transcriptional regulator [Lachnospiraceae bacterium]